MGVREPMPDEIVQQIIAENRSSRVMDTLALVCTASGLVRQLLGLPSQIARFQLHLNNALAAPPLPIPQMTGEELVAHYRDLERQLLKKWDAPLVNDFFAMIFYGLLRSLCVKWLGDASGTLQNELLLDGGDIISAEPPRRILAMAALAATDLGLPPLLVNSQISCYKKIAAIQKHAELASAFDNYLLDFGDRCLEELKLESPTVRDDSESLLLSIGLMASRPVSELPALQPTNIAQPRGLIKCCIFRYVLRQARDRVRTRENLRFERTRLFGRVRAIFRELGARLHADGLLESADDIFYLEVSEVLAVFDASGTCASLGALARQRRLEIATYSIGNAPPDRFQTRGPLHRCDSFQNAAPIGVEPSSLTGSGACPGRVIGRVRVVIDPRGAKLEPGEILVARQTDPGWVVLFPAAAGLLVERGSLLSHSAIVSRELRLPCIVSLPGITQTLKTGDLIEMDGSTGIVRILENPDGSSLPT